MLARHAYNIRALLVHDLRETGGYSLEEVKAIMRLRRLDDVRALAARGQRLGRSSEATLLKACGEKPIMRAGVDAGL